MAKTVVLADNTELNIINASSDKLYMQGSSRESLVFTFNKADNSIDDIYNTFNTESKTIKIGIKDTETEEVFYYNDYTILGSVSVETEIIEDETNEKPQEKVQVIKVVVGQKTYTEKQLDTLLASVKK